jgi:CIC family chloride channel protein
MTITVALSYGVRKALSAESIYTLKLVRRGHYMPEALQTNFHQLRRAHEVMETHLGSVPAETSLSAFARAALADSGAIWYLVTKDDAVTGLATKDMALQAFGESGGDVPVGGIALHAYVVVPERATVGEVAGRLRATGSVAALVSRNDGSVAAADVTGLITRHQLGDAVSQAADLFGA